MARTRLITLTCLAKVGMDSRRVVSQAKETCVSLMDFAIMITHPILSGAPARTKAGNRPHAQRGVLQVCGKMMLVTSPNLTRMARFPGFVPGANELWWNKVLLLRHVQLLLQAKSCLRHWRPICHQQLWVCQNVQHPFRSANDRL